MRFGVMTLIDHVPDALSGHLISPSERFREVIELAVLAEELGFDAFGVGERHGPPFLSSSPPAVLGAIAARTHRIRLFTTVTVLSTLDPVRVAEDYATVDQLSGGRLEMTIGKGNAPEPWALFGRDPGDQYALQEENYELLRRLWSEEKVTWSGSFRPPLGEVTTLPRPYQRPPAVWHGSATSERSVELAALWGDPLFSANAIQPVANYARLIDRYRARWAAYGHDPSAALVGSGGTLYAAADDRTARREFGPYYETAVAGRDVPGNNTPFRTVDDAADHGPAFIGSPGRIADKIRHQHDAYGHALQFFSVEVAGLPFARKADVLRLTAAEVLPTLRHELPDTLAWPNPSVAASDGPALAAKVAG
ncbi:LLM class flavin-dependent oxidoreductase [Streptomyces pinistramenti]|uniref:LLM class flavin-dependent oxidoreductase n=1 Tax=Streptomyces pinistramenti TaxID=2884812 RepID=UPI001D07A62E|nr:LLM class flavin-dependent oxidoreductase [Streptomyces pinistramenti]MCB5909874.1 LLM class flavin-dependent oxidoreductase [Streptomyces pinistramenti]